MTIENEVVDNDTDAKQAAARRSFWTRSFVAYFWFVGWDCLSLGVHFCWSCPNIEIHVPFGFIRVGWIGDAGQDAYIWPLNRRAFGWRHGLE